ncbi:MAG TPA: DUF202 domain-containing protein [Flavobacterium sp.]|jgi:putative membrane protein
MQQPQITERTSNQLKNAINNENTDLLLVNEHLANERTFLAWIRTGIGIMAFGFVAVKFSLFVNQISPTLLKGSADITSGSDYVGIGLVAAGALTTLLSYIRYRQTINLLREGKYQYSTILVTVLTAAVFLMSILLVVYLLDAAFQGVAAPQPIPAAAQSPLM